MPSVQNDKGAGKKSIEAYDDGFGKDQHLAAQTNSQNLGNRTATGGVEDRS